MQAALQRFPSAVLTQEEVQEAVTNAGLVWVAERIFSKKILAFL